MSSTKTAKAQFERMLLLDHKYRELKGNFEKGNTQSLQQDLKIPVTKDPFLPNFPCTSKSLLKLKNKPSSQEEAKNAAAFLASSAENPRFLPLRQTNAGVKTSVKQFKQNVSQVTLQSLFQKIKTLEKQNEEKDHELDMLNRQIEDAKEKLGKMNCEK